MVAQTGIAALHLFQIDIVTFAGFSNTSAKRI